VIQPKRSEPELGADAVKDNEDSIERHAYEGIENSKSFANIALEVIWVRRRY